MAIAEYTPGIGTWYWGWGGGGGNSGGEWYGQGEWDGFAYGYFAPSNMTSYTIFDPSFIDYTGPYGGTYTPRGSSTGYADLGGISNALGDSATGSWFTSIGNQLYSYDQTQDSWDKTTLYKPTTTLNGIEYQWNPATQQYAINMNIPADQISNDVAEDPSLVDASAAAADYPALTSTMQVETEETGYGIGQNGVDFIKQAEGLNLNVYTDPTGNQTFGFGHKLTPADSWVPNALPNMTDSQKQDLADTFFAQDLQNAQQIVYNKLGTSAIGTLNQSQYDSLVADAFNAGNNGALGPNMVLDIRTGDFAAAGTEFNANYGVVNGVKTYIQGLANRNAAEATLFNTGNYNLH